MDDETRRNVGMTQRRKVLGNEWVDKVRARAALENAAVVVISADLEAQIAELTGGTVSPA